MKVEYCFTSKALSQKDEIIYGRKELMELLNNLSDCPVSTAHKRPREDDDVVPKPPRWHDRTTRCTRALG